MSSAGLNREERSVKVSIGDGAMKRRVGLVRTCMIGAYAEQRGIGGRPACRLKRLRTFR